MAKKKGKAQNGRAKQKHKAKGSTPRSTPRSRGNWSQQTLGGDWDDDNNVHFRGFAQNSPFTPFTPRGTNATQLRHHGITFVRAGATAPELPPNPENAAADTEDDIALDDSDDDEVEDEDEDVDDSVIQTNIVLDADIESSNQGVANLNINATTTFDEGALSTTTSDINITGVDPDVAADDLTFIVDTVGDATLVDSSRTPSYHAPRRAPSPALSDSSEEIVLFHGRGASAKIVDDPLVHSAATQAPQSRNLPPSRNASPSITAVGWGARPSKHDTTQRDGSNWTPAPALPYWKKGKGRAVPRPDLGPTAAEREAFADLPVKESKVKFAEPSMHENSLTDVNQAVPDEEKSKDIEVDFQSLTASKGSASSRRKKRGRRKDNRTMRQAVVSDDEMSEAAYNDYMENLLAQLDEGGDDTDDDITGLKSSNHPTGPSLVVDGQAIGSDEVLPKNKNENDPEGTFELADGSEWESDDSDENPDPNELSLDESLNASDLESSDLEDELEYTEQQQWEDEDDLRRRRIERMSDEHYARCLDKQQALGYDTDELVLEDGRVTDNGFGDIEAAREGLSDISNFAFARRAANKHGMRRRGDHNFPDALAFAETLDQYGNEGFDIMDFERPSLRPTKKGRKGKLPPELEMLSDEELRQDMASQWEKDRSKKRQKKLERESLRAAGLLGSAGRTGVADLKAKYPLGMNMRQVHDELRSFLQDENLQERAFPPMDKANRKALHEISVALNLSSKSQGAGRTRFPIVYKTSRTGEYSSEMFLEIVQASSRGFLSNHSMARNIAKKGGVRGVKGGRGGSVAAATVRHGEVVGAGAAEISHDSFGHKLMLKMGWTKGQALGKDGEGLLVPVEQRMRVGTAGLG